MHVIELRVDNYKRLVAIDVAPKDRVIEVVGKNAAGKSTLLESMLVALGGAGGIPSKPIRKGQSKASIRLKLGDDKPELIVTRTFASKEDGGYTTQLTVEAADGARYQKPQQLLDDLLGHLSFDPLAFTRMKPAEQLTELRAFVPDVDFEKIDGLNRSDYERRTDVNRQVRTLSAQLQALVVPGDPRVVRVDEGALVAELEAAGDKKAAIEEERARRQEMMRLVRTLATDAETMRREARQDRDRIEELKEEIAHLEQRAGTFETRAATAEASSREQQAVVEALLALDIAPDTSAIKARIDAARKTNADVTERERAIARRTELEEQVAALEKQSTDYTDAITKRNEQKATAVTAAKLPVEGLGFGDDEVLLNGLPFAQASSAEQLRVSVAIAAARNSRLRVIHVRDGSLLDDDGLELLRKFAEEHDAQIWLEKVAADSPIGIVIENGSVKERAADAAA